MLMRSGSSGPEGGERGGASAELARRFRRDFLTYLPARLIPAVVGLATVMAFTRLFSPESYGRYALVLAAGGIVLVVLGGWLRECTIRFLPDERAAGTEDAFFVRIVAMALWATVVPLGALAVLLIVPGAIGRYRDLLPWAAAWVTAGLLFVPLGASLQAGLLARRYALWEAVRAVLGLALALVYVYVVRRDVAGAFAGMVGATILIGVFVARELRLVDRVRRVRGERQQPAFRLSDLLGYGLPLVGWAAGLETLNLADRFILQWFRGSEAVGIYASNYYLADGGTALLMLPLLAAVKPLVMHGWAAGGTDDVQELVTAATRTLLLLLLPALAATAAMARPIAALFLDPAYREGYLVLPLVVAGVGAWGMGQLGHTGLQVTRRTGTMLAGVLVCATVNVGLNLVAVPRWGYIGAAATTLISYALYALFAYWASRRRLRWRIPWLTIGRAGAAAAAMCVGLSAIWSGAIPSLCVRILLSGVAAIGYGGLLLILGEFPPDERRRALSWIGRRDRKEGGRR